MQTFKISSGVLEAEIATYGATLKKLVFEGVSLVAGYATRREYEEGDNYFGATVGRTCNRTGKINHIDGREYILELNERGVNHLHGGFGGLSRAEWRAADVTGNSVRLECLSPDGADGYPGNLEVTAEYILEGGSLTVRHRAKTDKPTWVSLTNHSYFNLNGIGSGSVFGTRVRINAREVSTYDENARVTGREEVEKAFGFDTAKEFTLERGFDHNFYLNGENAADGSGLAFAASARGEKARMEVFTDLPCLQFYTGGFIKDGTRLQDGAVINESGAFCFETQFEPGSPSRGEAVLRPGETYGHVTVYKFSKPEKKC
ncbi:MAG: galactose mutarotase [Clostridia bacterium]|nr:galactose mutarotase [Clostridia bacterium]